jgi:hypothetical protein
VIKTVKNFIIFDKNNYNAALPNSVMQFNKDMLRELQRLMVSQAKFELEDFSFEGGRDETPCRCTGYKILLRDHITKNEIMRM